jgi:general secretion pathway protein D
VVYLKNADATKLAQTLRAVVSGDTSACRTTAATAPAARPERRGGGGQSGNGGTSGASGQQRPGGGNTARPVGPAASRRRRRPGPGFIQADASTNTLIITAPESVYRNLRAVIDMLDVRRAQVYIEALIVESPPTRRPNSACSGSACRATPTASTASAACSRSPPAAPTTSQPGGSTPATARWCRATACRSASSSRSTARWAWARSRSALENDGNANILSTPNMITLDNELATIKVGQNVPIITGQFTTGSGGATAIRSRPSTARTSA